jgi:translocation protein SEC72
MNSDISLYVERDAIYCQAHHLETCASCDLDLSPLNKLANALSSVNGAVPPPNYTSEKLSSQILYFKENGNTQYQKKNYDEAIKLYSRAVDLAFTRPVWESSMRTREDLSICLSNRAAAYMAVDDWINAYVDAVAVVQLKNHWSKGHFRKGRALMGLKRFDEAVEAFKLGLTYDPENKELQKCLTEAEALWN